MSQSSPLGNNYYVKKMKQVLSAVFPDQSRVSGAFKSAAQGAGIALAAVVITSALISFVLLLSDKSTDLASILLSGIAVTLGSFGAMLLVDSSDAFSTALGSEVGVGLHSVTIAAITLGVVYRISRRSAKASHKATKSEGAFENTNLSPLHLGLGFALMTLAISYVSQGMATTSIGQISFRGMTLLSAVFVFALVWAASYAGQVRGLASNSDFEYVWRWITRAIRNFVVIYSALIALAFLVLLVRNFIEPTYAYASNPQSNSLNLSADQALWIFVGIVLYGANMLIQFFLLAMGINVGLDIQGSQGLSGLLGAIDTTVLGNSSQWLYTLIGPWGYVGVLILVTLVALVSGARAADQVGANFNGVTTYLKALFIGLFTSLSIVFVASVQVSVSVTPLEGDTVSSGIVWGASTLGAIAFGAFLIYLAHHSAGRSFNYIAHAFPKVVLGKRDSGLVGEPSLGAKLFGLTTIAALLIVAATPIAASTANRVDALTNGPVQVGEKASKTLTSASIKDLKKFLNPNASTSSKWLNDAVLKAAQPSEGYNSKVSVLNRLGEPWEPGNFDATITIELEKDGKIISKTIDTTSSFEENGLLKHVKYEPAISPTTVEVQISSYLKDNKSLEITLNGQKVKPGKYFAIPGIYKTKAAGYKLVAATDSTIYVANESQLVKIGYSVDLPSGASIKLDKAIQAEGDTCLKVSKSGNGNCISRATIIKSASFSDNKSEPAKYFDYRDYNFSSGDVSCATESRKDSLLSATVEESSALCETQVTFTRDYFKSAKKQVPRYVTTEVCVPGYVVQYYGWPIVSLDYDYYWEEYVFTDIYGAEYFSDEVEYDSCARTQSRTVQSGTKTVLVRGAKLSTLKLTSAVSKTLKVKGTLMKNGDFKVSQ